MIHGRRFWFAAPTLRLDSTATVPPPTVHTPLPPHHLIGSTHLPLPPATAVLVVDRGLVHGFSACCTYLWFTLHYLRVGPRVRDRPYYGLPPLHDFHRSVSTFQLRTFRTGGVLPFVTTRLRFLRFTTLFLHHHLHVAQVRVHINALRFLPAVTPGFPCVLHACRVSRTVDIFALRRLRSCRWIHLPPACRHVHHLPPPHVRSPCHWTFTFYVHGTVWTRDGAFSACRMRYHVRTRTVCSPCCAAAHHVKQRARLCRLWLRTPRRRVRISLLPPAYTPACGNRLR